MKTIYFVAIAVLFSAFAKAQQPPEPVIVEKAITHLEAYQGVELELGVAGVKLIEVLEDSRCPKDVQCIWAGQAKVLVEITKTDGTTSQRKITLSGFNPSIRLINEDGMHVLLRDLAPYPVADHKTKAEEYFLMLDVEN